MALRYGHLAHEVERITARRIVEIGTCRGDSAELLICAALRNQPHDRVEYHGFDLFEAPPDYELTGKKQPHPYDRVLTRLSLFGVSVRLYKGESRVTVPEAGISDADLVFIDGGHSEKTVAVDFENSLAMIRRGGVIILDDYWNYPEGGCNSLVDSLPARGYEVTILEPGDVFPNKSYGTLHTRMVRVVPR